MAIQSKTDKIDILEKGENTMGKQLYVQLGNPNHAYVIWQRDTIIRCCDDEEDYKDTVDELSAQGYIFTNYV